MDHVQLLQLGCMSPPQSCPDMLCEDSQNKKGTRSCKITNCTDTTEFTWVLTNDVVFIFCVVSYIDCSHPKILPCFAQLCKLMQAARDWRVFSVGLCHLCHRLRHFFPYCPCCTPIQPRKAPYSVREVRGRSATVFTSTGAPIRWAMHTVSIQEPFGMPIAMSRRLL